jgi:hypothetical protein
MSACIDCLEFKNYLCRLKKGGIYQECQTFDSMDEFNGKPDPCISCKTQISCNGCVYWSDWLNFKEGVI